MTDGSDQERGENQPNCRADFDDFHDIIAV